MAVPKAHQAEQVSQILAELGISSTKLVMPTRHNLEEFEGLIIASGALVDMKRQVDRVQQELRTLRAQKEGFIPPVEAAVQRVSLLQRVIVCKYTDSRHAPTL